MNILLINLTRFGDLLQSRALVHDLAVQGHRVGMVCLENFAEAARLLPEAYSSGRVSAVRLPLPQ